MLPAVPPAWRRRGLALLGIVALAALLVAAVLHGSSPRPGRPLAGPATSDPAGPESHAATPGASTPSRSTASVAPTARNSAVLPPTHARPPAGQAPRGATTATPPPVRTGLLFGATVQGTAGSGYESALEAFEGELGRRLAVTRVYSDWDETQPSQPLLADRAHGRAVVLSIKPRTLDGAVVSWASIAAGQQDARIRAQAAGLRSYGRPVLLAFHHEADIAHGYGTAAQFVAAFRHYVQVFRAAGATNVRIGVIFTPVTFARDIAAWYPGDGYVDWIGTDAYNFGSCAPGVSGWRSLAQAAGAFHAFGAAHNKPLVMAEWGSAEDPATPGRKADWISAAVQTMDSWPDLTSAIYFDHVGTCDWRLSTSTSAFASFRAADLAE